MYRYVPTGRDVYKRQIRDYMPNLVSVDISRTNATAIPDFTFSQKKYLLRMKLPHNLKSIGQRVFSNCGRLCGTLELPASVTAIEFGAFMGCDNLRYVLALSLIHIWNPTELEDVYLPYKPKRKTRAEAARQKGLEPLATILLLQRENNLAVRASSFVKGDVKDIDDALKGARDIIAEQVNEDEHARNAVRNPVSYTHLDVYKRQDTVSI